MSRRTPALGRAAPGDPGEENAGLGMARGERRAALWVLTVINFLNYLDRYVLSSVLPWIKEDFLLSDGRAGFLGSMFMVMFLAAAPFSGYLGDRTTRKYLVAGGILLWSLATVGSGLAPNYATLLVTRALIGVGEAGYATVAPGMIADLYPRESRGRVLAYFYLAVPVGSSLGYLLGGVVGQQLGWRAAFYVAGAPGLVMAVVALFLREPRRGAADEESFGAPPPPAALSGRKALLRLVRTPAWRINTLGSALMLYSLGALAFWMPTFLVRTQNVSPETAATSFGAVSVVAGILGTLCGGWAGDRAFERRAGGHLRVSSVALLVAAPLLLTVPFLGSLPLVLTLSFFAGGLLASTVGPLNAALVGSVPATLRSTAVAMNVLLSHLLGDALSPTVTGWVSDARGLSLAIAISGIPVLVGGLVLRAGARRVDASANGLLTYPG